MKEKLRRFMFGRYGQDGLNQFLLIVAVALYLVALISNWMVFSFVALALMILCLFRMFSRNGPKRQAEFAVYYRCRQKVVRFFSKISSRIKQHKLFRFYKCPNCSQELRVPRGKGRISIRCPKCSNAFIKKT